MIEHERVFPDQYHIAVLQRSASDALFIDEGAVRALQVLHDIGVAVAENASVMARNSRIVDDHCVVGQPSDRRHQTDRTLFQYPVLELQN